MGGEGRQEGVCRRQIGGQLTPEKGLVPSENEKGLVPSLACAAWPGGCSKGAIYAAPLLPPPDRGT